jgi:hypothetical protein
MTGAKEKNGENNCSFGLNRDRITMTKGKRSLKSARIISILRNRDKQTK